MQNVHCCYTDSVRKSSDVLATPSGKIGVLVVGSPPLSKWLGINETGPLVTIIPAPCPNTYIPTIEALLV